MNTIEPKTQNVPWKQYKPRWYVFGPDGALVGEVLMYGSAFYVVGGNEPFATAQQAAQSIP